jgi:hypothetical protein
LSESSGTTEDAVIAPWWSLALIPDWNGGSRRCGERLQALVATRIHTADPLRYE